MTGTSWRAVEQAHLLRKRALLLRLGASLLVIESERLLLDTQSERFLRQGVPPRRPRPAPPG